MMMNAYPRTESDRKLADLGYDLLEENREAVRLANLRHGEPVLDVATGSGRMLLALVEAGHHVISCDISEDVLRKTRERVGGLVNGRAEFRVLDATNLALETGGLDSVVTANSLHHMDEPGRVLEEMTRVLKPDGKLLIAEFSELGFEVIGQVHREVHGDTHDRGRISTAEIDLFLRKCFNSVERHDLPLNRVWIAGRKRS